MKYNESGLDQKQNKDIEDFENNKLMAGSFINQFNTFVDIHSIEKNNLFITDIDQLKLYKNNLEYKLNFNTIIFTLIMIIQSIIHVYVSYLNLKYCKTKIKEVKV